MCFLFFVRIFKTGQFWYFSWKTLTLFISKQGFGSCILLKRDGRVPARLLIWSRVIESATNCNQTLLSLLNLNSTQNTLVNWIIRLFVSLLGRPKVIIFSGGQCICWWGRGFEKFNVIWYWWYDTYDTWEVWHF